MLSEKAKELIKKSHIVSFEGWEKTYPSEIVTIFQQADNEGRYLTDEDILRITKIAPHLATSLKQAQILRDDVTEIVNSSRAEVLATFSQIIEPGGGLYPPMRAEACWRDFWHFLRCITYGIAGQSTNYTSKEGLGYMEELYQELQVPLDAMVLGLRNLKVFSLKQFTAAEAESLAPYFEHLISQMEQFSTD
ncbi:Phycocyanin [Hyella patelloides LEGE 07179]|uniref:Phycocyanin n=1 Tax=Hyella patelloides LEGE 07179 TaxID=945734 RepID=A0A563W3L3_9CYAN|nr:phycobilisome protein [Hyella patelloides]VEP18255.1 Phycocyanin [Hyella patelloides LEGE 07179]